MALICAMMASVLLSGCITTTYGSRPKADPGSRDKYSFTIYKNAFATRAWEDEHLKELLTKFMAEHGYKDYKIESTESGILVNRDIFHVKFYRDVLR